MKRDAPAGESNLCRNVRPLRSESVYERDD
ncbi:Uncharacterised protein [Vibrio cholerae]|nr:Uncharacterised protein [Vibrio cholerae]CSI81539.1 Uncharacterised protein [Vibrio cholerae]